MNRKSIFHILIFTIIVFCNAKSQNLSLVVYSKFVDPQKTYDSLIAGVFKSGLVDSINVIGRPIWKTKLNYKIDTLRVEQYGVSYKELKNKLDNVIDSLKPEDALRLTISNKSGQSIPISALTSLFVEQAYYKPRLYIPKPETYNYKSRNATRINFYYRTNERRIIDFIDNNIQNYADYYTPKVEYEIVMLDESNWIIDKIINFFSF